jgi:hypothetical protein
MHAETQALGLYDFVGAESKQAAGWSQPVDFKFKRSLVVDQISGRSVVDTSYRIELSRKNHIIIRPVRKVELWQRFQPKDAVLLGSRTIAYRICRFESA